MTRATRAALLDAVGTLAAMLACVALIFALAGCEARHEAATCRGDARACTVSWVDAP